jgi:NAD(P)-dependent dehydrogenase (short-subunit alcohol dehydrogenase family)
MKDFDKKVAVITGAASGIGRALAIHLARLGCNLAIADVNLESLIQTAVLANRIDRQITTHKLDVSRKNDVYDFAGRVKKEYGHIDIVINNAGVSSHVAIEEMEYEYFESLMNINFWGVVFGCKAFLPLLRERSEAHIVNVSSIYAIAAFPKAAAYNASKAAVRAFTETLAAELLTTSIGVSCVFPGAIRTNIVNNSESLKRSFLERSELGKKISQERIEIIEHEGEFFKAYYESGNITSAETAAEVIIDGIRNKHLRIMIGDDAKALDALVRSEPENYLKAISQYEIFSI